MTGIRAQRGFSLVEIMVALVLGLLLTAAVIYLFVGNKQTYRTTEAVARLQENGRFALKTVGYDLRMAGHLGCANHGEFAANVVASGITGLEFPATAVEAVDDDSDGQPDALVARFASASGLRLDPDTPMETRDDPVTLEEDLPDDMEAGDAVLLADCSTADIFRISSVDEGERAIAHEEDDENGDSANVSADLTKAYRAEQGAAIMTFVTRRYEVKPTGRSNAAGDPISALYRDGEELVEGVESMQVQLGECLDSGNRRYRDWSEAPGDPYDVSSVRIGLLLHSTERVREEADGNTYGVAGTDIVPAGTAGATGPTHGGDRRLRRVFSTTVALRNRPQDDCDDY